MDNKEFDNRAREIAINALSDAYEFAKESKTLEALVKTAELAGKMIDFREPPRDVGFKGGGNNNDTEG